VVNFCIVGHQKVPVHKIQFCCMMCHKVCNPQLFHAEEISTLLFNFVAVVKVHLFGVQGMPKIILEMSQILSSFLI
jgi:hypothetical protein